MVQTGRDVNPDAPQISPSSTLACGLLMGQRWQLDIPAPFSWTSAGPAQSKSLEIEQPLQGKPSVTMPTAFPATPKSPPPREEAVHPMPLAQPHKACLHGKPAGCTGASTRCDLSVLHPPLALPHPAKAQTCTPRDESACHFLPRNHPHDLSEIL